jgi:hypothetical protein
MNIKQEALIKVIIGANILLLVFFLAHIMIKIWKNRVSISMEQPVHTIFLILFCLSVICLFLLMRHLRNSTLSLNKEILTFLLFFITILFYDLIIPEEWVDAKGDVITSEKVIKLGPTSFLKEYHIQSLQEISQNESTLNSFLKYNNYLPFVNYNKTLEKAVNQKCTEVDYNRTMHHPPSWFIVLGVWQNWFGKTVLSFKILSKIIAIIFIFLIYFFTTRYLKLDNKIAILLAFFILLTPRFLIASETPKSDLFFGVFVILFMIQLYRLNKAASTKLRFTFQDINVGIFLAMAILVKFTGLLLLLPVIVTYLINYKYAGIGRLIVVLFGFLILPTFLYLAFDYDMLLNIITGRSKQDFYINNQALSLPLLSFFVNGILYGFYYVGIPIIVFVVVITSVNIKEFIKKSRINELVYLLFYFSIFFLLWRSQVSRHQISFIIFLIPLLATLMSQYKEWKNIINLSLLLLFTFDILFLINSYLKLSLQYSGGWIFNY